MVYDDDTSRPVHHVIHSSDRVRHRPAELTLAIYDLIADWAARKPAWGAQRIHEQIRKTRHDVSLEMIHYVLTNPTPANRPRRH